MKQWVEPESTKPWKETFSNQSENELTTKDVGLDKEETEEALILTSLGVHSESTLLRMRSLLFQTRHLPLIIVSHHVTVVLINR